MQPVFLLPGPFHFAVCRIAAGSRKSMITTPSPEHGRDLLEEKVEGGIRQAKIEAAKAHEFSDAPYSIIKRFQESAPGVTKRNP
jgi:hypothetical protein